MAGGDAHTESATEPEAIALNPALDRAGLAAAFARAGRLHIPDLLVAEHADRLHAFLNGRDFLDFARAVTGLDDIAFADSQATRYAAPATC